MRPCAATGDTATAKSLYDAMVAAGIAPTNDVSIDRVGRAAQPHA